MSSLVVIVIGASRGIGRQIALTLAQNGYTVVVSAKSSSTEPPNSFPPDPNSSESTIDTVTQEIKQAGGKAVARQVNVRDPKSVDELIQWTIKTLGHVDAIVYN